ncbi:PREDICTED: uncharacterized protein LOC105116480 [Populus euphratica]|uniref:Uncharacterized protein LOC105116480 n=1 Tax=Populus euphratica TaxID=75702 RepID=A0AAJ6TJW5_POPEU|nr:PREDICTED: uncharacterized protein LOC105116480 [Populus euphratica]
MEANQKNNFVCKFCNKRYPCGKSLGGHIRIHLNANGTSSTDEEAKVQVSKTESNSKQISVSEAVGQPGYVLRDNPKKTSRFVGDSSNTTSLPEKVCKECGKGFQSLKALCGHMACHSKNYFQDQSGTTEKLKEIVSDNQSDSEATDPSKPRRSKRMRYKTIDVYTTSLSLANAASLSSASDIEQEQEEVAKCLMMLSKDSGFKGCFSSLADSSDNNSVVLEGKSSSTKTRINVNNAVDFVSSGIESLEMKKSMQRGLISTENDQSENSDSGYFRNGPKKVESDVSVHGFARNDGIKKYEVEFGSSFDDDIDAESGKRISRFRRVRTRLGKDFIEEDLYDQADGASMDSQKRCKNESYEFLSSRRGKCVPLGGRRASHNKTNGCSDSIYESGENSVDTDYVPNPIPNSSRMIQSRSGKTPIEQNSSGNAEKNLGLKKGKLHECPFCPKVFRSGQALGGHKRSHFAGAARDRTVLIKQDAPEISMRGLIDLNLPVSVEEEAGGFGPW